MLRKLLGRRRAKADPNDTTPSEQTALPDGSADDASLLPFAIRPLQTQDLAALTDIFHDAIDGLTGEHYSARQRKAWKKITDDDAFHEGLTQGTTVVAENLGEVIGFAQLHPCDHIRMLYVRSSWSGLGISTLLYQYLEDEARIAGASRLGTDASLRARRFFEQMGFRAGDTTQTRRKGVALERVPMEKVLIKGAKPD